MSSELISDKTQSAYKQLARAASVSTARAEAHAKATHERFNIFSTLLKESDEVRLHTRFIHCLLNPEGTHDCGSLFLNLFFETLTTEGVQIENGKPVVDEKRNEVDFKHLSKISNWTVLKEASRSPHGQIDLLLESQSFGIAIENKIHAWEQEDQLSGYGDYLRSQYKESFHLIYLTLDGKESSTARDHKYLRISYRRHVIQWLDACLRETYSIVPINQVIIQYRAVVRRLTNHPPENDFMKSVHEFILANPEILRNRDIIIQAVSDVRGKVLDKFAEGVMSSVKEFVDAARLPDTTQNRRFGIDPSGTILITPKSTNAMSGILTKFPIDIRLELCGQDLLLGMKVPAGINLLPPEIQLLLTEMCKFMENDSERSESWDFPRNKAWPTGWDRPLKPLDDDLLADWLSKGTEGAVITVSEAVRLRIDLLARAYLAASGQRTYTAS